MSDRQSCVFVIDDDAAVRDALALLVSSFGYTVESFDSAQSFLDANCNNRAGCVVADLRMPGMSGLELQESLSRQGSLLPFVIVTAHGDVPSAVTAMRWGAIDFIQKPFRDQALIERVQEALRRNDQWRADASKQNKVKARLATLTTRERQVLDIVVRGKPNKSIAKTLGLSERTVEIHRARVMKKMAAKSLPQLVKMVMLGRDSGHPTAQ